MIRIECVQLHVIELGNVIEEAKWNRGSVGSVYIPCSFMFIGFCFSILHDSWFQMAGCREFENHATFLMILMIEKTFKPKEKTFRCDSISGQMKHRSKLNVVAVFENIRWTSWLVKYIISTAHPFSLIDQVIYLWKLVLTIHSSVVC